MSRRRHEVEVVMMARMDQLEQVMLQRMPEVGEKGVKKTMDRMVRQWSKADRAASRLAKGGTKELQKSIKGVSDQAGDADSVLKALADGIEPISPGAAKAARSLGDMSGALEGLGRIGFQFGPILGVVAVAALAVGAAYVKFSRDLEEAEALQKDAANSAGDMARAYRTLQTEVLGVDTEFQLLVGTMDDMAIAIAESERKTAAAFAPMIKEQEKIIRRYTELRDAQREAITTRELEGKSLKEAQADLLNLNRIVSRQVGILQQLNRRQDETTLKREFVIRSREAEREAIEAQRRAEKGLVKQLEAEAKALAELNRLLDEADRELDVGMAGIDARNQADQSYLDFRNKAYASSDEARLALQRDQERDQLAAITDARIEAYAGDLEIQRTILLEEKVLQMAIEEEYQAGLQELQAETAALAQEQRDEQRKALEADIEAEQQLRAQAGQQAFRDAIALVDQLAAYELDRRLNAIAVIEAKLEDSESDMTDAKRAELEERLAAEQKAATRAFRAQQAAALANVIMQTVLGIQKALADYGIPWGFIPAGVVSAVGTANTAIILAQQPPVFHAGGMVTGAQTSGADELLAVLRRDEAVLTGRGVNALGGADGVNAANRGAVGGGPTAFVIQYKHRVLDVLMAEQVRRNGPLGQALNTGIAGQSGFNVGR